MQNAMHCCNCDTFTKVKRRDFSAQAWSALLVWGEIQEKAIEKPLCESCYMELRDCLIDRADEIGKAVAATVKAPAAKSKPARKTGSSGKVA